MLPPNTILQNRYRVIRELGHGGMGTVYEALDQRINCIVALKETSAKSNDDEARRAFEREAALLGNLQHSSLPKVMDYFSEGEGDFLVMEFIPTISRSCWICTATRSHKHRLCAGPTSCSKSCGIPAQAESAHSSGFV